MTLPSGDGLCWIVQTYARLRAGHGEAIGSPQLVQPTGDFFPDEFRPDAPSVARLLQRMIAYAPVADDIGVELVFATEGEDASSSCGSGACASVGGGGSPDRGVEELEDGYRVFVDVADLSHPDRLTTSLARSVGGLVLLEAGEAVEGEDAQALAELAATACGFGVLLANGSAVWGKSCGGLRVAQRTLLAVEELSVALALFVSIHGLRPSVARAHLGATQREAFDLAQAWTESNPYVADTLRHAPSLLEGGAFRLEPLRGLVGRWFHKRRVTKEMRPAPVIPPAIRSDEQKRRFEEARALVDEVMGEG